MTRSPADPDKAQQSVDPSQTKDLIKSQQAPAPAAAEVERNDTMTKPITSEAPIWESSALILNQVATPIVIADTDYVIQYCNPAGLAMFKKLESVMRKQLPDFRANKMLGTSIDDFHKNPAHQRRIMERMSEPHNFAIEMENVYLTGTITQVENAAGKIEALFVEWQDRTEQKRLADEQARSGDQFAYLLQQMGAMARAHDEGDIDVMIGTDEIELPDIRNAAHLVNEMVLAHINTKKAAIAVVEQFGEGNFDAPFATLPGKKIFINNVIEKVRGNFRQVVGEIRHLSDSIVAGNLDVEADLSKFNGEYRFVVESFEKAFSSLNGAFSVISEQIEQVAASVGQVSHASQTLSTNSQIASASVEEVSASIGQTDQQVRVNADASKKASTFVGSAAGLANQGADKIKDMVSAMHGIKSSSQDIGKIIKVIDEIAFQTNLLALNAAVEAARAGQHGRGFAVVAQEVRNLAGRSAKAARETSDLIEDASNRVNAGVRIADETSEAFTGIAEQITRVKEIVEEIDRSSAEQSRGVAQISLAMSEISKTALETSQQADELAAGSAEMSAATEQMRSEIRRYSLRKTASALPIGALDNISPELMAQIQRMLATKPSAQPMRNGKGSLDQDARGFGSF